MVLKKWCRLYFLIIVAFVVFQQNVNSQDFVKRSYFEIKLVDYKTNEPVVFANVLNSKHKWWVITDTLGIARVAVYPGDTLTITSLGYALLRYIITDSVLTAAKPIKIKLRERRYELKPITFYNLGTYEHFKYKVLHMDNPDNLANIKTQIKLQKDKLPTYPLQEQMSIPLLSPISLLYSIFSKEEKSKQKLAEILKDNKNTRFTYEKFNRGLVKRVTGLNEQQLDEFMLKYRPSNDFLYYASEYDIIGRIFSDLDHYKSTGKNIQPNDTLSNDTVIKK